MISRIYNELKWMGCTSKVLNLRNLIKKDDLIIMRPYQAPTLEVTVKVKYVFESEDRYDRIALGDIIDYKYSSSFYKTKSQKLAEEVYLRDTLPLIDQNIFTAKVLSLKYTEDRINDELTELNRL